MPRSRLFFLSMSIAAAFCGISSATVWENHLWIRSCYLPHLYNAEQSFCPERMIDRYANRYMSVARGVLPADERVLRHRRIRAGARAQEPNRHGRRREAPRRRGRPRRDHAHQRLPVGLPARASRWHRWPSAGWASRPCLPFWKHRYCPGASPRRRYTPSAWP